MKIWEVSPFEGEAEEKRKEIKTSFEPFNSMTHPHYLSVYEYLSAIPQKYFNKRIGVLVVKYLGEIESRRQNELDEYLTNHMRKLDHAIMIMSEINNRIIHDTLPINNDKWEFLSYPEFLEVEIHPTLLRIFETVLAPLAHLFAYFSRSYRDAGTDKLDLYNICDELLNYSHFPLDVGYNHTVRNAIAHGGVFYRDENVEYKDRRSDIIFSYSDIFNFFDHKIDICNGLVFGFKSFFLTRSSPQSLPWQIRVEELQCMVSTPWWSVKKAIPLTANQGNDLLIFCDTKSDFLKMIMFHGMKTAVVGEFLFPGYDRYRVVFTTSNKWLAWLFFQGKTLSDLREQESKTISDYCHALEKGSFVSAKDSVFVDLLLKSKILFNFCKAAILNLDLPIFQIKIRSAKIFSSNNYLMMEASVVLDKHLGFKMDEIRNALPLLYWKASIKARKGSRHQGFRRFLPLRFSKIWIYQHDVRLRELEGQRLGEGFICMVERHWFSKTKSNQLMSTEKEKMGRYVIYWNRKWLGGTGYDSKQKI